MESHLLYHMFLQEYTEIHVFKGNPFPTYGLEQSYRQKCVQNNITLIY